MNKNNDDFIFKTNISENEKNTINSIKSPKENNCVISEVYNSDYCLTKEEQLIATQTNNLTSITNSSNSNNNNSSNHFYKSILSTNTYKFKKEPSNNKNLKQSRMTKMVQGQVNNKFSLDNLGQVALAELHRSANRPLHKINKFNKETKFCPCCNLPCAQEGIIEPFKFMESVENFAVCGKGIYLYFLYISFAVCCFIIIILMSSISFNLLSKEYYKNVVEICKNYNVKEKCDKENINDKLVWSYKYSVNIIKVYRKLCLDFIGNEKKCNKTIANYSLISFYCMISLLIFNIVCLYIFHYLNNKLKQGILPSDYTLLITNLYNYYNDFAEKSPEEKFNINKFKLYLKEKLFNMNLEQNEFNYNIHSINLCYKINEYMKTQKKCEEYKYKIFQIKYNPYQKKKNEELNIIDKNSQSYFLMPFTFFCCLCSIKKEETLGNLAIYKHIKEWELQKSIESYTKLSKFAGCIFVTFNTLKDKEKFYNNYPHYFIEKIFHFIKNLKFYLCCCISDDEKSKKFKMEKKINVFYANEPEDIIWENMEYTKGERIKRKLFIYFISLILLLFLFFIVFQLTYVQDKLYKKENWKSIKINLVSYSIALIILIVNKLFQMLLERLTEIEKPNSYSKLYLSCSVKLTIFAFITSSIVPYVCNLLKKKEDKDNNLMIKNITNLFIVNAVVLPLPFTLIPLYFKKFRIWLIIRNGEPFNHYKTQKELNDLYELPDMNISYKYSDVCQTILMTFFYMPIFPLGALFSAVGLILTFICEKLYFIHFYKRPEMFNESICKFYLEYFIFNIWIYAIGDYIFTPKSKWSLLNIILFAILTIIPYNKLILLYLDHQNIMQKDSTSICQVYFTFYNDYERQNPITKKEGLCKYINSLRDNNYISKRVQEIATNNVENINIMEVYYKSSIRRSLLQSQFAFADKQNFLKRNMTIINKNNNTNYLTSTESNLNEKEEISFQNQERKNNNAIIEEKDFKIITRNYNSLIRSSLQNPFLLGINDSIFQNVSEEENEHVSKEIKELLSNENMCQSVKIKDIKNSKFQVSKNEKNNKSLEDINEDSKEEDVYNLTRLNEIQTEESIQIECQSSRGELENKKCYTLNNAKNPIFLNSNFKKDDNNMINCLSRNINNNIDLRKSANFLPKKSFNDE